MGMTRDLFKEIRDIKGTFYVKVGKIKDREGKDLKKHKSLRRLSYFSLLSFGTLHLIRYNFPFFLCLSLLFSQLFVRPPQPTILPSCISFSLGWFWSQPTVQCCKALSIVLQALCLPDLVPSIYSSLPVYNHKGFDLDHLKGLLVFFTFFNLSLNFAIKSS